VKGQGQATINFGFSNLDFGVNPREQTYEPIYELFFRQSKIGNPKAAPQTKMAGAFGNGFGARSGWALGIELH
jgi:hypothetical protein